MTAGEHLHRDRPVPVLDDFSLEITGRDADGLAGAAPLIPAGTRVNITYLGGETAQQRLAAVRAVQELGFVPVAHIAARRLRSATELGEYVTALADTGAQTEVFLIAGDPATPAGPFPDSLSVLESGVLQAAGVQRVGIAGYPEGHPDIPSPVLAGALRRKVALLAEQGLDTVVTTQFSFDVQPVLDWIAGLRRDGVDAPVRVGVPGPVGIKRLLAYARRFGVKTSAGITRKYGFSLTNLVGTAGPGAFVAALSDGLDPAVHGKVRTHFYTFGDVRATAAWVRAAA
ncbi:methylenetetrahydrofolate reductase [Pseudonocardia thermophila]|jgi:5,10-methylenetetrahydrofolate reductase|uniref:methylenetetrahydrofolate reductase n=1 Tax=Pseudonocardia thermophila TaxID=1848 RepID=UPI00248DF0B2|nr:methylenetetrahydrofolate reductase [Pseudonocardia thermophila]